MGGASRGVLPMEIILEALNVLAMVSTIAAFLLEVFHFIALFGNRSRRIFVGRKE